jgi:hypothetical protein
MEPICSPNVRGYGQFCSVSGILIERVTEEAAPARGHAGAPGVNVAEWAARDVHDQPITSARMRAVNFAHALKFWARR